MRKIDENGYLLVENNPLTKEGVFPYSGAQIGLEPPDKIFKVYRPAEELQKPETLKSFELVPFINEHTMLGDYGVPAESKGVLGVVGQNVKFNAPYLTADIKIFGNKMKDLLERGKNNISAGYSFDLDNTSGNFNGENYDCIQRNIRCNHIALVQEGRCGKDVRVLDKNDIIPDALPLNLNSGDKNMQISSEEKELAELIKNLTERVDKLESFKNNLQPIEEKEHGTSLDAEEENAEMVEKKQFAETAEAPSKEDVAAKVAEPEDEDVVTDEGDLELKKEPLPCDSYTEAESLTTTDNCENKTKQALDSALKTIEKLKQQMKKQALDSGENIFKQIAKRDALAKAISKQVGTFAFDSMSLNEVVNYGAKKFDVPAKYDVVLAYLKGAKNSINNKIVGQDSIADIKTINAIEEFYKD